MKVKIELTYAEEKIIKNVLRVEYLNFCIRIHTNNYITTFPLDKIKFLVEEK